jgi:cytoskeleton protein RodZ
VGQDLHKTRQRRAKTLADVSSALKISSDYLTAIEEGRFEDLPARVYAVGYVRSYSAYLGLDARAFVARFKEEMAGAGIAEPTFTLTPQLDCELGTEEDSAASIHNKRPAFRWPSLPENAMSQAAGAVLLIGAITYSVYHVIASAPQLAPSVPTVPVQLADESLVPDEPRGLLPATGIARQLHVPKEALHEVALVLPAIDLRLVTAAELSAKSVRPAPPDSTELAAAQPQNVPVPVRKDLRASVPAQKPAIQSVEIGVTQRVSATNPVRTESRRALRLGQHYGTEWKFSRITLRLHGPTELRVGDNRNNVLIDRALDAGDTYRVPDVIGLKLSARDAGAIEIILDDTTVGFAGRDGVPARQISLDPKALAHLPQGG